MISQYKSIYLILLLLMIVPACSSNSVETIEQTASLIPKIPTYTSINVLETSNPTPNNSSENNGSPTITSFPSRNSTLDLPENWFIEESIELDDYEISITIEKELMERYNIDSGWSTIMPESVIKGYQDQGLFIDTTCIDQENNEDNCLHFETTVHFNDQLAYTIDHGKSALYPCQLVPYVFVFGEHWAVEIRIDDFGETRLIKDVIVDSISMNEKYGFDNSFNLLLIENRPFFFYEKKGSFGFVYDFSVYPLGYSNISHADCCAVAWNNPRRYKSFVWFLAKTYEDDNNRWVIIGKDNSIED